MVYDFNKKRYSEKPQEKREETKQVACVFLPKVTSILIQTYARDDGFIWQEVKPDALNQGVPKHDMTMIYLDFAVIVYVFSYDIFPDNRWAEVLLQLATKIAAMADERKP